MQLLEYHAPYIVCGRKFEKLQLGLVLRKAFHPVSKAKYGYDLYYQSTKTATSIRSTAIEDSGNW
jgi:hypothetical protein